MKKLLMLCVAVLGFSQAYAQVDDDDEFAAFEKTKNSAFFIGPKAGVTFTSMTQPDEADLYDANGLGFSGGIAMKARFGKATENSPEGTGFFGIGLELKYKQNKVKTIADDDLALAYLEAPVTIQLYPFAKSAAMNGFYIEGGASLGLIASKSPDELKVTQNLNQPYPGIQSQTAIFPTGELKGGDVHPVVGLGYTIPKSGFDINVRYHIGMTELAKDFPCKMSTLEISLAYLFKAAKF